MTARLSVAVDNPAVAVAAALLLLMGCSGSPASSATPATPGTCAIPLHSRADFDACHGTAVEESFVVAKTALDRSVARIVVPSRDPGAILASLAGYSQQWVGGSNYLTVFAAATADDAKLGPYNRGRLVSNDGTVTIDICTSIDSSSSIDVCAKETTFSFAWH